MITPFVRAWHPLAVSRKGRRPFPAALALFVALGCLLSVPGGLGAAQLPLVSYSTEEGLASDTVERIRQDPAGRLWFACRDGLSRFDGEVFVSYGEAEGLPAAQVLDVLGDAAGRIWAATAGGLAVLDPKPTRSLTPPSTSLAPRSDAALSPAQREDSGSLSDTERFVVVPLPAAGDRPRVHVLAGEEIAEALRLWVGTEEGLFVATIAMREEMGKGGGPRASVTADTDFRRVEEIGGAVWDVVAGRPGELWLAAASGLWHRPATGAAGQPDEPEAVGRWRRVELARDQPVPRRLLWHPATGLWAGHEEGGGRVETPAAEGERAWAADSETPDPGSGDAWRGLAAGAGDGIWVATAGGLLELGPSGGRLFTEAEGLLGRQLTAATVDRDGNLWLGTESRGALRLAHGGLLTYGVSEGLAHPRISSIFEGPQGRFFVSSGDNRFLHVLARDAPPRERAGAPGPGVERSAVERFEAVALNLPPLASSAAWGWNQVTLRGRGGDWWVPTGRGLYRFAGDQALSELAFESPKAVLTRENGLAGDKILRLYEDRRGDLWIGSLGGESTLSRWRRRDGAIDRFGAEAGLPRATPSAFAEDSDGRLWIGFDDGSLVRRWPGEDRFQLLATGPAHFPDSIYDLFVDSAGKLWIATGQAGLLAVESVRGQRLEARAWTTAEGLVANTVFTLAEDLAGRLYLGTPRGVQRLDPARGALLTLTTAAGLASNVVTVALRDRRGDLWFGTLEGLSRLRSPGGPRPEGATLPARSPSVDHRDVGAALIAEPSAPPLTVLFHELVIGGTPHAVSPLGTPRLPDLELGPEPVDLELAFHAVSFRVGERLRYQLRLGEDEPWRFTTTPGRLRLAGLRPGRYALEVRAVRPEGPAAGVPARLAFTVLPPVWRRGWFLALLVLALLLFTYGRPRLRLGRLLAAERVRRRIATDLHDDLGSNLARISVLSEVLDRRIGGDVETRRLLASVGETAREVSDALDDSIWSIDPRRDDLASLASRLRTFAADVLGGAGVAWRLELGEKEAVPKAVALPPEVRRHLLLIGKEAITNIARHAGATSALISLRKEGRWLVFEVSDDGRGLEASSAAAIARESGYGLASIEHRVRQLGGTLQLGTGKGDDTAVRTEEGRGPGTVLRVRLPLGRRATVQRMFMRFSNGG